MPIKGPMEDAGVVKLYEPSPTPCLYVAPVENITGRAPPYPLISGGQLNSDGSSLLQQAQGFSLHSGFPIGCADSAAVDGRRPLYEVNPWLWQFGRGRPRLGGLNVEETAQRQEAARDERLKR